MEFLANILSTMAEEGAPQPHTWWLVFDEPECPEELL